MQETWKDIKGYEGLYQVSNLGKIKSLKKEVNFYSGLYKEVKKRKYKERIINLKKTNRGYTNITLYKNGIRKHFNVHRLVADTFILNPNNLSEVNHKDGNKENNSINNLEWVTNMENMQHAIRNNLTRKVHGEEVGGVKLTERDVLQICELLKSGTDSLAQIGKKYNVSKHCIFDIKRKKSWAWLTKDYNFY